MFDCLAGLKSSQVRGCILADQMGLGKTLQVIALVYALSKQSPFSETAPLCRKTLVVCPLTLVSNWKNEIKKFLGDLKLSPVVITSNRRR